jgi:hypothetical protein
MKDVKAEELLLVRKCISKFKWHRVTKNILMPKKIKKLL